MFGGQLLHSWVQGLGCHASGQGQGPACSSVGSGLLVGGLFPQALGLGFSCVWCLPLVGKAALEARAGSLGLVGARSLVGGAGSWAFWWTGPRPEGSVGSGSLQAACLLVSRAVSPPS